jgi:hypothetical protein
MDNDSDHDIPDAHPEIPVIEQTDVDADTSEGNSSKSSRAISAKLLRNVDISVLKSSY